MLKNLHGKPVADIWAGAVMRKPLAIQKCYITDQPTRHGVESPVRDKDWYNTMERVNDKAKENLHEIESVTKIDDMYRLHSKLRSEKWNNCTSPLNFQMRHCISIRGSVRPSIRPSVCLSVDPSCLQIAQMTHRVRELPRWTCFFVVIPLQLKTLTLVLSLDPSYRDKKNYLLSFSF